MCFLFCVCVCVCICTPELTGRQKCWNCGTNNYVKLLSINYQGKYSLVVSINQFYASQNCHHSILLRWLISGSGEHSDGLKIETLVYEDSVKTWTYWSMGEKTWVRSGVCVWRNAYFTLFNLRQASFHIPSTKPQPHRASSFTVTSDTSASKSEANGAVNAQLIRAPLNMPRYNLERLLF